MQITNKLLKEAIADAEAVRETAVANAKLVLEESITPQIREMIARRLRVEAEHGVAATSTSTLPTGQVSEDDDATETPFEDGDAVHGDAPQDTSAVGSGENKMPSDDASASSDVGTGGEAETDSHTDWYDDWSESDFDLDGIIKELEEDIAAMSLGEGGESESEDEEGEDKKEVPAFMKKDDKAGAPAPEAPVAKAPENGEEEEDDEKDLEEILAELEADDDEFDGEPEEKAAPEDDKQKVAAHLARIKNELAQYREVVNTLRERLQEVNLLNAKLLFTNKMFRNQGLNNEQKVRIVESFDRATTVREVKLVYTALVENLSTAAKTFVASRKKVVAEGLASKVIPSKAPKATVIVENSVAKRLQELAGII